MSSSYKKDLFYMKKAFRLALNAKGKTFPNPAVGAVIVKDDLIVGSGATQKCGGHHAEKVALLEAGENAKNATLYVTLEPCCHFGRTPPCVDAVIASGIKRVVISVLDPNPLVSGKGVQKLEENGIEVTLNILEENATSLNEDFFYSIIKKRAWVTLKLAMTLDGRIADNFSSSKWITNEKSRAFVHELRRRHAAVAVGRSTLDIDNPQLTVRHKKGYFPAKIVFSSERPLSKDSYFYQNASQNRRIVVVCGGTRSISTDALSGIEYWKTGKSDNLESLGEFLEMAYEQGISSVFVEGGQKIASQFLEAGLVNRVYLFYGNKLLGNGKEGVKFTGTPQMSSCISLNNMTVKQFDQDLMITGLLNNNHKLVA